MQGYWIDNADLGQVQVYRRNDAVLTLVATLQAADQLTSPLLPEIACPFSRIFSRQ